MRPDLGRVLVRPIAHRGLHDRTLGIIENSFHAAERAMAAGFGIECDIQRASDGEAVVFHDETLERLTTLTGRIDARPSAELATVPLTSGRDCIPTLPAFLAFVAGRVPLVIEIKSIYDGDMRLAERAVDLVGAYAGPVVLKSFDAAIIAHCRARGATCPLGLIGPAESGHDEESVGGDHDFLSWSIRDLATLRSRYPTGPLMSWTVRSAADAALAKAQDAQIVFEGYRPA